MRILLLSVHHPSIGSGIADHLPPLGLLSIGGPLIDDGHEVRLIDAELGPMPESEIVEQAVAFEPEIILFGHSGSTSAHPAIAGLSRRLRVCLPQVAMIYGGVFPTYHWREILAEEPQIEVIVRGEGEETCRRVVACFATDRDLSEVPGIAYGAPWPTATGVCVRPCVGTRDWDGVSGRSKSGISCFARTASVTARPCGSSGVSRSLMRQKSWKTADRTQ
jgi:anaerobic magnesium-protoporphyrin IX monomethyl ester cyclase